MKSILFVLCLFISHVQSIYFYLEQNQVKCFKDEVVKNYVSDFLILTYTIEINLCCLDIGNDNQHIR